MVINSIQLKDFRNYRDFRIEFHPSINFIYGKNGQGKTNLIESLYFITHLKSFRTSRISDLSNKNEKFAFIRSTLKKQDVLHEINIGLDYNRKRIQLDNKNIKFTSEYIRNFFSLLFAPDQLTAFKEYPQERRNFIDRILFLIDPEYFQRIKEFNRIKKQKGHLLRMADTKDVFVWNQLLSQVIPKISRNRESLVKQVNLYLSDIFKKLTGREGELQLVYRNDFHGKIEINSTTILAFLNEKIEFEKSKGFSCYGAHKDNYWLELDGNRDKQSFSQGEYRISFLALQLAVNELVTEMLGFNPVLLLDDVFSELDESTFEKTMKFISTKQNQIFISSTRIPNLYLGNGKSFHIHDGSLVVSA